MSEKLKRLLFNNEIETLLNLTKNSDIPEYRFYYLAGLRKLGEYHIALSYISEYQMELYTFNAPQLIKWHIDILLEINELDQALNVLKQYGNFPYFSLETNEIIATLGEKVQNRRKQNNMRKTYDLPELERRLFASNKEVVFSALNYIDHFYHESYLGLLQKVLLNSDNEITKALIILLLATKGYDEPIKLKKFSQIIKVKPASHPAPGTSKVERKIKLLLDEKSKAAETQNFDKVVHDLFNHYTIFLYPLKFENKDINLIVLILEYYALLMMGHPLEFNEFFSTKDVDINSIISVINKYHFDNF